MAKPTNTKPMITCCMCKARILARDSHNANPIVDGRCCNKCLMPVIAARLRRLEKMMQEDRK